jgi:hypothetical protein
MAHWQLGEKAQARTTFERADKALLEYERHVKRGNRDVHPKLALLRQIRAEAAALLGMSNPLFEESPEPTPNGRSGPK